MTGLQIPWAVSWTRLLGTSYGHFVWALPMGTLRGNVSWALCVGTSHGHFPCARLMGTLRGNVLWALCVGTLYGHFLCTPLMGTLYGHLVFCHCSWLYVTPVSASINALPVVRIMLTALTYTKWSMMNALAGWDFMVIFAWPPGGLFDGFGL